MKPRTVDVAIIGGGIAGASIAAFLAEDGVQVALFEMESSLAYHTTGRSAALLTPNYGPDSMRAFAGIAVKFFNDPPLETNDPLITPKLALSVVTKEEASSVERPPGCLWWNEDQCLQQIPFLRKDKFVGGLVDPTVSSIDVHGLHSMYIRMFTNHGGKVFRNAPITALQPSFGVWDLTAGKNTFQAKVVVNAAGAWGDRIAALANLPPVGLLPRRRTVILVSDDQFNNVDLDLLPFVVVEPDYVYFQNFGSGKLMISPADETPSLPCDAQPDELDIAIGIARFEEVTNLKVSRVDHSWAGLRTFAPDRDPVIGWEPNEEGFFWLTGQGGYGVFSSPGIGRYAASLVSGNQLPAPYLESSYPFQQLSPKRFRLFQDFD